MTRQSLTQAALIVALTVVSVTGLGFLWRRTPYALEDASMSKITVTYDTHEKSSVKIFFGGKLALEKSFSGSGSIDPVKVAVTARITGGAPEARVEVVDGASTHQESAQLPPGRIVALWKNPETGSFELK